MEKLSLKKLYDDDINQILKNLYDTNFFEDIEIVIKDNILKIKVIENKIIQSVKLRVLNQKL